MVIPKQWCAPQVSFGDNIGQGHKRREIREKGEKLWERYKARVSCEECGGGDGGVITIPLHG